MKVRFIRFFLFLFCTVLLLSSCAGVKEPEPLCWQKYPLERQIVLENDGGEYSLLLKLEEPGKGTLVFRAPEALQDICFEVTPEECRDLCIFSAIRQRVPAKQKKRREFRELSLHFCGGT